MKLLLYCTKSKPYLLQGFAKPMHTTDTTNPFNYSWVLIEKQTANTLNGKVVAKCDYEIEEIEYEYNWKGYENIDYFTNKLTRKKLEKQSCLTNEELKHYLKLKPLCCVKGKIGYAIHIKNLTVFDEPKELDEFYSIHNVGGMLLTDELKKAPQNMQRVSTCDWEYGTYNPNDIAVLISIQPQWLCKILNGEKTIEVRKKILNNMIK